MPGTSGGTGQPIWFKCFRCRSGVYHVRLTGKCKEINDGRAHGRSTNTNRQYKCQHCGHVGWSRHIDLKRKGRNLRLEENEST